MSLRIASSSSRLIASKPLVLFLPSITVSRARFYAQPSPASSPLHEVPLTALPDKAGPVPPPSAASLRNRPRPIFVPHKPHIPYIPPSFGKNQQSDIPDASRIALTKVVDSFQAPVRYAFAYGSGVFSQLGYEHHVEAVDGREAKEKGKGKPLVDFILATPYIEHFHSINMRQNPSHYPSYMRLLGSKAVSKLQEFGGAGVWFVAYVEVEGVVRTDTFIDIESSELTISRKMVKYGVVSVDRLCKDLLDWDTLYLSGRMHKPVSHVKAVYLAASLTFWEQQIRIIRDDPRVKLINQVNLTSALRVALLTLPETFSEHDLYERIAGLSYAGAE